MPTKVLNCGSSIKNMTAFQCEARYGAVDAVYLSLEEKSDITYANALVKATWTTNINEADATRLYIFPSASDAIRNQEDPVFFEGNLSKRRKVRDGRVDFAFEYHDQRDCVWSVAKSFNGQRMYAFFQTENEAIIGGDDGTNLLNVPVDVYVSEPIPPENKDGFWKVILYVYLVETEGNFAKAVLPNDSTYNTGTLWKASSLNGIVDCLLTAGAASAASVVFTVTGSCDAREVAGLVLADFTITGAASMSNVGNVYTVLPTTTFTSPLVITAKNQPTMTTKGYEFAAALTVTF